MKLTPYLQASLNVLGRWNWDIEEWKNGMVATDGLRFLYWSSDLVSGWGGLHEVNARALIEYEKEATILRLRLSGNYAEVDLSVDQIGFQTIGLPRFQRGPLLLMPDNLVEPFIYEKAQSVPVGALLELPDDAAVVFSSVTPPFFHVVKGDEPTYSAKYSAKSLKDGLPAFGETVDVWSNRGSYLIFKSDNAWYAVPPRKG